MAKWTLDQLKMLNQENSPASLSVISSPALEDGLSLFDKPAGKTIVPSGLAHALVSLSARQAKARGLLTSGTYGPPGIISLASGALQSSLESKLMQRLELDGGI